MDTIINIQHSHDLDNNIDSSNIEAFEYYKKKECCDYVWYIIRIIWVFFCICTILYLIATYVIWIPISITKRNEYIMNTGLLVSMILSFTLCICCSIVNFTWGEEIFR